MILILSSWITGKKIELDFQPKIPAPALKSQKLIEGLKYEVWKNINQDNSEIVLVFKGTTPTFLSDWISNLRWMTFNPILRGIFYNFVWDYYHQVQVLTPAIVKHVKEKFKDIPMKFTSTGHSLGGGLAQQAAYSCSAIKKVIVFNSTPVTGYKDIKKEQRLLNHVGIETSRIYHAGEVLSYLRDFIRIFILPLSTTNPCIKEYQFSFLKGSAIKKHDIREFATYLVKVLNGS